MPSSPQYELHELLVELFDANELLRLAFGLDPALLRELPEQQDAAERAFRLTRLLDRHGLLTGDGPTRLLHRIWAARREQRDRIQQVAEAFAVTLSEAGLPAEGVEPLPELEGDKAIWRIGSVLKWAAAVVSIPLAGVLLAILWVGYLSVTTAKQTNDLAYEAALRTAQRDVTMLEGRLHPEISAGERRGNIWAVLSHWSDPEERGPFPNRRRPRLAGACLSTVSQTGACKAHDAEQNAAIHMDLGGADFHAADLEDADLAGTYLAGADLSGIFAEDASLLEANLQGACLEGAVLPRADLRCVRFDDAVGLPKVVDGARFCASSQPVEGCVGSTCDYEPIGVEELMQMLSAVGKAEPCDCTVPREQATTYAARCEVP